MTGNNFYQLWFLLINLFVFGIIVATLIRCIKDKVRYKVLFIILILLLFAFSITTGGGTLSLGAWGWIGWRSSGLLTNPNGGISLTLVIPIGAIIYWRVREKYIRTDTHNSISPNQNPEQPQIDSDISEAAPPQDKMDQGNDRHNDNNPN